ncbi:MAG: hypothetical protein QCI82_01340 [Candidatus Thermoplasmatota archaeon]|nr:hypothetical protein [Candidatus Thermoplasmatota archaeon]
MELLRNKWFYVATFSLIFILSIDLWTWGSTSPAFFGLPHVIIYTMALEGVLFISFILFARYFWTTEGK